MIPTIILIITILFAFVFKTNLNKSTDWITKFKINFLWTDKVVGTSNKRILDYALRNGTLYEKCKSQNVIHLITYHGCSW